MVHDDARSNRWHVALLANSEYHGQGKHLPGVLDDAGTLESCEFYTKQLNADDVGTT